MRKIAILLFCFLTINFANAQKITWGSEEKLPNKKSFVQGNFIEDETGIYTTMNKTTMGMVGEVNRTYFQKYNKSLKLIKEVVMDKEYDKTFVSIQSLKGKFYTFHTDINKKTKKATLSYRTLNKQTLKLSKTAKKFMTLDLSSVSGGSGTDISKDGSKYLFVTSGKGRKEDKEKISINVLDSDMNVVWSKPITLPYADQLLALQGYYVNNNGDVFITAKKFKDKAKNFRKGEKNYEYILFSYTKNGAKASETPINIGTGKFISDIALGFNKKNDIVCMGFYSEQKRLSIKGSFTIKLDNTGENIIFSETKAFETSFLDLFEQTKKDELFGFDLGTILFKEDGSSTLIAEHTGQSDRLGDNQSVLTFNDLIVLNVSDKGKIDWVKKVAKRQYYKGDIRFRLSVKLRYFSYEAFTNNNKIYILYNDADKNMDKPVEDKKVSLFYGNKINAVLVSIDSKGTAKKESLFKYKDEKIIVAPGSSSVVNDKDLIIYGVKGSKYKLGRLTLE